MPRGPGRRQGRPLARRPCVEDLSLVKDRFLEAVSRSITRRGLLRPTDSVLVAVSGGPDSTALFAALVEIGRGRWRVGAAHVNHRLRGRDSERDQRFAERLAARLGCTFHAVEAPIVGGQNLEERAREKRYAALLGIARDGRYRRVATGHTLDDQAETVLHRASRGAGIAGLGGIHPERADGVIRPLLDVSRADVLRFLNRRGLRYRMDRTNASPRFTRNRIRRLLLLLEREVNPAVRSALGRLADLARDDEMALENLAHKHARSAIRDGALDAAQLLRSPAGIQRRILRRWLAEVRGGEKGIGFMHVERVRALASDPREGRTIVLPGGSVTYDRGRLHFNLRPNRPPRYLRGLPREGSVDLPSWHLRVRTAGRRIAPGPWRAVFDLAALDGRAIVVRSPRPGDRLRPLGLGGSKKLQDVFVDAKVPRGERPSWPVVEQGGSILWVPGLARSDRALVEPRSRKLLVVEANRRSVNCRRKSYVLPSSVEDN
jgi:tRNA(Ile)-lysidine synthase